VVTATILREDAPKMSGYDKPEPEQHDPMPTTASDDRDDASDPGAVESSPAGRRTGRGAMTRPQPQREAIDHLQEAQDAGGEGDTNEIADERARVLEEG
jgi:hypothetical protein